MRLLLVHPTPRPFITTDIALLRAAFDVEALPVHFRPRRRFIHDMVTALAGVWEADVVLSWFGGAHALLPFLWARMLGKPCAVIASGVDVADEPSLPYGHMRGGWLRAVGHCVFQLTHRVLAVSRFTAREAIRNAGVARARITVIPHGVALPPERTAPTRRVDVVTVATIHDARTLQLKGLDTLVAAAARLPDRQFEVIGGGSAPALETLRRRAPANVTFTGALPHAEVLRRLQQATVYAQLSAYESFGMALAEAMACGCRPVVTRRGALPEVVGNAGWYVPYGDVDATASALAAALAAPHEAGRRARARIAEHFPLEQRAHRLVATLRALIAAHVLRRAAPAS